MKNKSIIILFILAISTIFFACKPNYPVPTFENNKIKYVIKIDSINDNIVTHDTTEFIYDNKNRLIITNINFEFNNSNLTNTYKYKQDKIISEQLINYNSKSETDYFIDQDGNIFNSKAENKNIDLTYENSKLTSIKDDNDIVNFNYKNSNIDNEIIFNNNNSTTYNFTYYNQNNNLNIYVLNLNYFNLDYLIFINQINKNALKEITPTKKSTISKIIFNYKFNNDSLISFVHKRTILDTSINTKDTSHIITHYDEYYNIIYY